MNKIKVIFSLVLCILCLVMVSCKPKHIHEHIDGVCECGDTLTYNVQFLDKEGSLLKEETVKHGSSATAPDAPILDGFTFIGWSIAFDSVKSNIITKAVYEVYIPIEYTITLKGNGGTFEGENEIVYTDYREVVLPIPTREKFEFIGWYQGSKLIEKLDKNANYTLRAEWKGISYDIKYNLDGGIFEGNYPETYEYSVGAKIVEPVKEGYSFEGFYSSSDFSGEEVLSIPSTNEGNVELFAKWRKMNPVVTYHLNNGNWYYQSRDEIVNDFLKDAMAWGGKTSKPDGMVAGTGETHVGFANVFQAIYGIFSDPVYGPKWSWLRTYIIDVTPSSSATPLSRGEEAYWRYSLGAFLFCEHRASYPLTADYTQDLVANGFWETLSKYSKNEVELGNDFKLATPKRIYYVFDGWYLNENYTGERVEVTDKNIEVYAKWIEETPVNSIAITNKVPTLKRFEEYQLEWEIDPSDAAIKSVLFTSSDESVATVSDKGVISPLKNGAVTITIKSLSPSGVTDSVEIEVYSPAHFDVSYETTSYVNINSSIKLNASYFDINANIKDLSWKSLNTDIAIVDNDGNVKGISSGIANIRAYLSTDENIYFDFTVTVLPDNLNSGLMHVIDSHESNIFTRYNLGIGAGTPVYYADILGSVNRMLFNYDYSWNTKHLDGVMANGKHSPNLDSEEYPVEFVTVHYTAGMTEGSNAEATSIFFKGAEASAHFCTGNDGIFQCLDLDVRGWHAGDGTGVKFEWNPTGVKYNENDPKYPEWGISNNAHFTINGVETSIKVPKKEQRGSEGYVTDSKWLNDQGFAFKVVNGEYYMGTTWWCYSNVWEGRICSKGGNNNSIGIESAVDYGSDLWLTWHITARLVADLLIKYELDITRVVGHHFFAAKDCPQPLLENDLEIWWEFIDLVDAEYKTMTKYQDETFTFEIVNGSDILSENGRITEMPEYSQIVTYKVTLSDGTSVTLATAVPGIYTK